VLGSALPATRAARISRPEAPITFAGQDRLRMSACYGVSLHCSVMHTPRSVDVDRLQAASCERIDGAALAVQETRLRRRLQGHSRDRAIEPPTESGDQTWVCSDGVFRWSSNSSTSMWTLIEKATNTEPEAGATHAFVVDADVLQPTGVRPRRDVRRGLLHQYVAVVRACDRITARSQLGLAGRGVCGPTRVRE
jgi:hypothetical protein